VVVGGQGRHHREPGQQAGKKMEHLHGVNNFYSDRKFCDHCETYVSYLMSVDKSFCVECGNEVHLFSKEDWQDFNETLQSRRTKGGRPSKQARRGKESA
jgi:hypothetical protein